MESLDPLQGPSRAAAPLGGLGFALDFDQESPFDHNILQTDGPSCLRVANAASPSHLSDHVLFASTPGSYNLDPFSSTFEDPFSFPPTPPSHPLLRLSPLQADAPDAHHAAPDEPRTPIPEEPTEADDISDNNPAALDNKLLAFSPPTVKVAMVDESGSPIELSITAELRGMFFVAEGVSSLDKASDDSPDPSRHRTSQLTCYRRNLWQSSVQITLPRQKVLLLAADDGDQSRPVVPIAELAAFISATESTDGKATEIITMPWKSSNPAIQPAGNSPAPDVTGAPQHIILYRAGTNDGSSTDNGDVENGSESRVTLAVAWKRLQFKHATANNGRRKGVQQHFLVKISLAGKTAAGNWLEIAEVRSSPLVVRGRGPRNFVTRREATSAAETKADRRTVVCGTSDTTPAIGAQTKRVSKTKSQPRVISNSNDWVAVQTSAQPPTKRLMLTHPSVTPLCQELGAAGNRSDDASTSLTLPPMPMPMPMFMSMPMPLPRPVKSMPITSLFSEDERGPITLGATKHSTFNLERSSSGNNAVCKHSAEHVSTEEEEDGDSLYEYFPLGMDDWSMPVDAVYRPHFVHHATVSTEAKAEQARGRSKRYFVN